jgi:UDP-N-acetylmuramate: L-alanyl-gamma-D-glutamyl-meso-diaminopimelate ligase
LGVSEEGFYSAIATFKGAARRLELVKKNEQCAVYKDFAHSPSKLKATTNALKEQYTSRTLIACMELHTFSSLNAQFLEEYNGAMAAADEAYVYFNPHTIEHKKLAPITVDQVKKAFGSDNIHVYTNSSELLDLLLKKNWNHSNLLMMSSGNFDGIDYADLGSKVCG